METERVDILFLFLYSVMFVNGVLPRQKHLVGADEIQIVFSLVLLEQKVCYSLLFGDLISFSQIKLISGLSLGICGYQINSDSIEASARTEEQNG